MPSARSRVDAGTFSPRRAVRDYDDDGTDRLALRRMRTRLVEPRDAEATRAIYNVEVLESTVTFDIAPRSLTEQQRWIEEHSGGHPAIVAVADDGHGARLRVALAVQARGAAYAPTVEDSVYVHRDARGRGVGEMLLREILRLGTDHGFHSAVARIVGGHEASIALHRKCGFEEIGCEREVGRKFGRWLDVVLMQRML